MKKIILSLVFMLNYFSVQAINIKLLKGTHTIVPADYSPVMGLSFLEWGIAEQLYRLSPKFQNKQLAEALEKNPKAASKNPELARIVQTMESKKNSATENLVMEMYHIVRGSFKRTNAPDNPVRLLKPHHMGEILKIIQDGIKQLQDRDSLSQQQAAEKAGIDVKLAALTKENNRISGLISRTQAEMKTEIDPAAKKALEDLVSLYQKQIEDLKVQRKTLEETVKLAESKNLQDYMHGKMKFQLLTMLNNLGFKNDKGKVLKWNSFVDAIVGSLKESIGQDALYTPNTTQDLLLSYVLVKSDTRDDLQEYFRGFLGNDSFLLSPEEYSSENINQILATKTDASRFEEFADLLCAYTYKEKYDSSFPKIVDNKEVIFKGIFFADCMDTTMRMLANIGTYKPSLGKVGVVPEGLSLNPVVEHFYHSENGLCAQSAEVGNGKVHQAWAQAIENVPGCVYTQIGTGPQDAMDVANICDGVIPTGSLFTTTAEGKIAIDGALYEPYQLQLGTKTYTLAQKKVGEVTYLLVPKDSELVCCEMMPNNLNIVTGLDYIFNLHLYSNINELFEPDFVSKNFSKICEKLGWQPQIGIAELDKLGSIDIPIDTAAGKFFIHVFYKGHGYVTVEDIAKLHIALEVPETTHESTVAAIVAVGFKKITDLPAELQTDFLYKDVPVLNNDQRLNVLGQMIQDKNNVSEISQNYIRSLIVSFSFVEDTAYLERMVEDFGSILKQRGLSDFVVTVL
ncbi:MAG TPA: hypothetical protein VLG50_02310, partial [Candidatus Saccharimonadales bacterium]|nr:hypothetical protein [Candidatus Saccharimonadales bacterium]